SRGEGDSSDQAGQGIIWSEESFVRYVRRRAAPLRQSRDCRSGFADGALLSDVGAAQRLRHAVTRGPEAAAASAIGARRPEVSPFSGHADDGACASKNNRARYVGDGSIAPLCTAGSMSGLHPTAAVRMTRSAVASWTRPTSPSIPSDLRRRTVEWMTFRHVDPQRIEACAPASAGRLATRRAFVLLVSTLGSRPKATNRHAMSARSEMCCNRSVC